MHTSLKILKTLCILTCFRYSCTHHQGPPTLHLQLPVTVCCWVGCVFQLWSVIDQSWKTQPIQRHTVTGGCRCRVGGSWWWAQECPKQIRINKVLRILRLVCIWLVFIHCCLHWCTEPWTWKRTFFCLSVCLCLLFTAPAGALMYYRELTNTVKSFNYGTTVSTCHISLFFAWFRGSLMSVVPAS
jgi:hypothetical protein